MLIKQRLFGLLIAILSAGVLYFIWWKAETQNMYYPKAAFFAPIGIVAGIFLLILPQYYGKPETTREKIIVFSLFAVGVILGLINWYLIDPGFFGF